jgi:hypothetical protein
MLMHVCIKKIFFKHFINPAKSAIILWLVLASALPLSLFLMSFFNLDLLLTDFTENRNLPFRQFFYSAAASISEIAKSSWPPVILAGAILSSALFYFLPKFIERYVSSRTAKVIYCILSLGIYLPYSLISLIFDHSSLEKLRRGVRVIYCPKESVALLKNLVSPSERGIKLHPGVFISKEQETKHFLVVATIGSGKTQLIFPMVDQIRARNDRMIVYDRKGDYCESFGEEPGVAILSPFDRRSLGWDIGADINTTILAEEFASALIPIKGGDKDSVWIEAARDLLTGVIKFLQAENARDWGFSDLVEILREKESVIGCSKIYHTGALQTLGAEGGGDDRQTSSVFLSLRTALRRVEYLAQAWSGDGEKLSLREWVGDRGHKIRTIIVGGNPRYSGLDNLVVTQIFNLIYSEVLSLDDSRSRRIWSINDEAGSQPKIPMMLNALTEGRSKGLRVICAVQSVSQIRSCYGKDGAEIWFNSFGTLLAGRVGDSETASFLAKSFGVNRIEKISTSVQGDSSRVSHSLNSSNDPALLDSDFLSIPSPSLSVGLYFWLRISGWPAARLLYQIKKPCKQYRAKINMDWLKEGGGEHVKSPLVKQLERAKI